MATLDRKDDYLYVRWSQEVKRRDFYTCAVCGKQGGLNSHHLNGWNAYPDQRYDIDNGVTLCVEHHDDFHEKYGKGHNTKEQFDEYLKIYQALQKFAAKKAKKKSLVKVLKEKIISNEKKEKEDEKSSV